MKRGLQGVVSDHKRHPTPCERLWGVVFDHKRANDPPNRQTCRCPLSLWVRGKFEPYCGLRASAVAQPLTGR